MRSTKVVAACIFNELQAAGLFLVLDGTSTRIDPSTSGRKYHKSVNNAAFIRNESSIHCFSSGYECIPIKAHTTVATQHMPCGLSNTDYRIWENISRVGLWEMLWACILGSYLYVYIHMYIHMNNAV